MVYIPCRSTENMATRNRYTRQWQHATIQFFDSLRQKVFKYQDFSKIIFANRDDLDLPRSTNTSRFVEFLTKNGLSKVQVKRESGAPKSTSITRYIWGTTSPYSIALSLRPQSYLSHATALHLHGLTDQIPKTVYVNKEQSPKPRSKGTLRQEAINRAFNNRQRSSTYSYSWEGFSLLLLSGKNTKRLEVTQIEGSNREILDLTKIERTLIDSTVRPVYAGGIYQVREAFANARDRLSVNTLVAVLKKLDYAYPYHQAIGLYMERAGYDEAQLEKVRTLGLNHDFYLTYGAKETDYSTDWRLFFPKGF